MIRPLNNNVLIEIIDTDDDLLPSGLMLPETRKSRGAQMQGYVVSVGPGRVIDGKREIMELTVGDKVLFPRRSGTGLEINDVPHVMIDQEEVFVLYE